MYVSGHSSNTRTSGSEPDDDDDDDNSDVSLTTSTVGSLPRSADVVCEKKC